MNDQIKTVLDRGFRITPRKKKKKESHLDSTMNRNPKEQKKHKPLIIYSFK